MIVRGTRTSAGTRPASASGCGQSATVTSRPVRPPWLASAREWAQAVAKLAAADENLIHTKAFDLPKQEKKIVITTEGIVVLGKVIARSYLENR